VFVRSRTCAFMQTCVLRSCVPVFYFRAFVRSCVLRSCVPAFYFRAFMRSCVYSFGFLCSAFRVPACMRAYVGSDGHLVCSFVH